VNHVRDQIEYNEFCRRGQKAAEKAVMPVWDAETRYGAKVTGRLLATRLPLGMGVRITHHGRW